MKKQDKHFIYIKQLYPLATSVVKPITVGLMHDIYITESQNQKFVCRFSDKIIAQHNLEISKLLNQYGIPAPKISIHNCGDCWCETYPFIPGKTLHERLLEGLNGEKLDKIYHQMIKMSYQISKIPYNDTVNIPVSFATQCVRKTFAFLNPSEKKLCHVDLHAKNIILDESDNLRAVLDLDAVVVEHLSVSHLIMMKDAYYYGYDVNKFTELNIRKPETQIKIINAATKIYRIVFPCRLRKQLLKIRVK